MGPCFNNISLVLGISQICVCLGGILRFLKCVQTFLFICQRQRSPLMLKGVWPPVTSVKNKKVHLITLVYSCSLSQQSWWNVYFKPGVVLEVYTRGWNQSLLTQTGSCCVHQRSSVCPVNGCAPVFLLSLCLCRVWAEKYTHSDSTILFLKCGSSKTHVFLGILNQTIYGIKNFDHFSLYILSFT